jgi:hypothetical protein
MKKFQMKSKRKERARVRNDQMNELYDDLGFEGVQYIIKPILGLGSLGSTSSPEEDNHWTTRSPGTVGRIRCVHIPCIEVVQHGLDIHITSGAGGT